MQTADIKVTIKTKKIMNPLRLLGIWKVWIGSGKPSYFIAFWAITHIKAYWISRRKLFPYFNLRRQAF